MNAEGFTVWLTGLRETGKRAISDALARALVAQHVPVEQLDVRTPGLEIFEATDPSQYEHRLGFLAGMLNRHGVAVVVATMSPSRDRRDALRRQIPRFMEVYVKGDESAKGHAGHVYEEPLRPDVEVAAAAAEEGTAAAEKIIQALEACGYVSPAPEALAAAEEERQIIKRLKDFGYM